MILQQGLKRPPWLTVRSSELSLISNWSFHDRDVRRPAASLYRVFAEFRVHAKEAQSGRGLSRAVMFVTPTLVIVLGSRLDRCHSALRFPWPLFTVAAYEAGPDVLIENPLIVERERAPIRQVKPNFPRNCRRPGFTRNFKHRRQREYKALWLWAEKTKGSTRCGGVRVVRMKRKTNGEETEEGLRSTAAAGERG